VQKAVAKMQPQMVSKAVPLRFIRNCGFNQCIDIMSENTENFDDQPLTEHLRELRSCLIYAFVAIFVGFCLSYVVIRPIGTWFFKPLTEVLPEGTSLIFTSYQEGFFFI
jgi:hypothetical protein